MRCAPRIAIAVLALASITASAADSPLTHAREAAKSWLALVDEGAYGESWEQAATLFRIGVSKEGWQKAARAARGPLGKLKSREFKSATFTRSLPGAPDGEYVVVQFVAQFENKASAVETLTPTREPDESWRVAGYYIK